MELKWLPFSLNHSRHDINCFTLYHSFKRFGDHSHKAKQRAAKPSTHFVVQLGSYRSSSRPYGYAAIYHCWCLYIPSAFVWACVLVTVGESLFWPLSLLSYLTSLDYYCLGEVRGNPKMDELQDYCHKKASQKPCYGCLALSASPVGSRLFDVSARCG